MSQKKEIMIVEDLSINKIIIKDMINNICEHLWFEDYIDITPELSQKICYCVKCEVTKR